MKIYNPSGIEILDVNVDDSSVCYREILGSNLTLQFSLNRPVSIPVGSYTDYQGDRYMLFYPENFKKHHTRNYQYTLVLHDWSEALKLYIYKDTSAKPYRVKFNLTATPLVFVSQLVDVMNLHDSGWSVGEVIVADERLISFNAESCWEVINRLMQEFNTECDCEGKKVNFRRLEKNRDNPVSLKYGEGGGFLSGVSRKNNGDKQPLGRLYVQGGERNISLSQSGSRSLLLPKNATKVYNGKTFRTDPDGMYIYREGTIHKAEGSFDGSEHYPKRVGTVSSVEVIDAENNFYDIIDDSIPAGLDYSQYRIPGETAIIKFQSGILAGREFNIEQSGDALTGYIHAERRFKLVPAEIDGYVMPGGLFVPQVGDKYAMFNISMPPLYIEEASEKMFDDGIKFLDTEEESRYTFTGKLDPLWSKSRWAEIGAKIIPGGFVDFIDDQFLPEGVLIRIVSVKEYVNQPQKPEITLSNAPAGMKVNELLNSIVGNVEDNKQKVVDADKARKALDVFTKSQKIGSDNLLRNAGFTGDFASIELDNQKTIKETEDLFNNKLAYWDQTGEISIIDEVLAKSGKGITLNGKISQAVLSIYNDKYKFRMKGKGDVSVTFAGQTKNISFGASYTERELDFIGDGLLSNFSITASGATLFNPKLERGTVATDMSFHHLDENPAFERLLSYQYLVEAIQGGDATVLGSLALLSMIQLGKYKDGVMEKVNAGISGIYNNDNDPAVWGGGSFEDAIRTVQRFIDNPNYEPSEAEWTEMAKFVLTHGGDGFFRGYIYALGGYFRGRVESNIGGNRIVIDPADRSLKMYNSNGQIALSLSFLTVEGTSANFSEIKLTTYRENGEVFYSSNLQPGAMSIDFESFDGTTFIKQNTGMSMGGINFSQYSAVGQNINWLYQISVRYDSLRNHMEVILDNIPTESTNIPV